MRRAHFLLTAWLRNHDLMILCGVGRECQDQGPLNINSEGSQVLNLNIALANRTKKQDFIG